MKIKKFDIFNIIKKINPIIILNGYSIRDKLNVIISLFVLGPLRKFGVTKREILITMKSDNSLLLCGDKSIHVARSDYEKPIRKFFDLEGGVFIDIGANLGKYTVLMGKKLRNKGFVISIEPENHTVKLLKQNIVLNKLKNVVVIEKACSSKTGKSTLYLEGTKYSGGLHSLKKYTHHVNEIEIEVETLDSIISRLGFKGVDLIKIDVEGNELEVLQGAQKIMKKYHPRIICESLDKISEGKITSLLKKFKYRVKRIDQENIFAY